MKNNLNAVGLSEKNAAALAQQLNELLANYSMFYQNSRGYHWHVRGQRFFELHLKFEELYNSLFMKIDEIAERILALGGMPMHKYSDYRELSTIKESARTSDGLKAVKEILQAYRTIIVFERGILSEAAEMKDEGTTAMMSDYIREQEKLVWMYSAYLD